MTIKQLGGVFGRNPTFNDVTIEGELTFDGAIDVNSDLTIDGNLFVQNGDMTMTDNLPRLKLIDSDGTNQELYFEESGGIGSMTVRNGSNNGTLRLRANNGSTTTNTLEIDTSGNVKVLAGNLVIGTSGKGIDFSATAGTGTSELLDDYEEGTWTPTLLGSASNPTVTYGLQRGVYTIVGRAVTVTCNLTWSAYSGGSGDAYVGGLPFSVESAIGAYGGAAISAADNITNVASRDNLGLYLISGTTSARLQCFGSATTTQSIVTSSVGSSGQLVFSASYQI